MFKTTGRLEGAHSDNIWSVCWTSQGKLVTGSLDGSVKLYNVKDDGSDIKSVCNSTKGNVGVISTESVSDGSIIVAGYEDSSIRLLSSDNLEEISNIKPTMLESWKVAVSPNDDILASGGYDGSINLWSLQKGHDRVGQISTSKSFVTDTIFSSDGNRIAAANIDGSVSIVDIEKRVAIQTVREHFMPVRSIKLIFNDTMLLMASDDKEVSVFDLLGNSLVASLSQTSMAKALDVSNNCRHFVVGASNGSVSWFDLGQFRCVSTFDSHKDQVWGVKYDSSTSIAEKVASVGDDSSIQIYKIN